MLTGGMRERVSGGNIARNSGWFKMQVYGLKEIIVKIDICR